MICTCRLVLFTGNHSAKCKALLSPLLSLPVSQNIQIINSCHMLMRKMIVRNITCKWNRRISTDLRWLHFKWLDLTHSWNFPKLKGTALWNPFFFSLPPDADSHDNVVVIQSWILPKLNWASVLFAEVNRVGDFPTTWSSVAVEPCEEPVDMEKKKKKHKGKCEHVNRGEVHTG